MDDHDAKRTLELSDDVRKAALNLMKHLRVNHFRLRVDGTSPELYITLGEGRHTHDAEMKHFRVTQETYIAAGLKN
jgi:type VI protein secretion system component Hcp